MMQNCSRTQPECSPGKAREVRVKDSVTRGRRIVYGGMERPWVSLQTLNESMGEGTSRRELNPA